jgi:Tol biopolymer transport system component
MSLPPGHRIGSYEVVSTLGAGGMGEVFRARDARLDRDVAIKVLPRGFASDRERVARFEREARMLASLNHAHIAAIYGVEEFDGQWALVLELVEGETLAARIGRQARGGEPPRDALPIARQIAEALDAAHEKGIVHRDLKPANIKITPAGVVKVLDFGLAKAAAASDEERANSPTVTALDTRSGIILGTAAYMSPEQARGQAVDKRADIWAFGCVLFELLTGQPAFERPTVTDTLAAIVDRDPDWSQLPASTPPSVIHLLHRCLDKDIKHRLRDIGDAVADLNPSTTAGSAVPPPVTARRGRWPWIVAAATSVVAVAAVTWAWLLPAAGDAADVAPHFSRIVQITAGPDREFSPVISPDGKWVAYISSAGGTPNVWLKFLAGGEAVNLTANAGLDISASGAIGGLDVSPDGSRIAVQARLRGTGTQFATWEIPAPLPGTPRALLDQGFLGMRWSPDGRQVAYIRAGSTGGDAIWVADGDGANRREIVPANGGAHMHWLAWSNDGWVYYTRPIMSGFNLANADIYRVKASGGSPEQVIPTLRRAMFPLLLSTGGLVYSTDETNVGLGLVWRPTTGHGPVRQLTFGLDDYAEPRASADGRLLVATRYENRQALVRIEATGPQSGRLTALTNGFGGDLDPDVAPATGRMVFSTTRAGGRHLWIARADGTDLRPLTSGTARDDRPTLSPDGQTVAFVSDRGGTSGIWIMAADGGAPRKIVDALPVSRLSWSRDGAEIIYAASAGTWPGLWRVSVSDGQVRRIPTPGAAGEPAWSPTADLIAYLEPSTSGPVLVGLAFVSPDGVPQHTAMPKTPGGDVAFYNGLIAWSPDGRRVALASQRTNSTTSIWIAEPGAGVPFRRLAELPVGPRVRGITWSPDGSAVIIGQHDAVGDIVLLE